MNFLSEWRFPLKDLKIVGHSQMLKESLSHLKRLFNVLMFALFYFLFFAIFDSDNYEIYLPDISIGYVSFSDFFSRGRGFTICFWLKTAHSGFFIEYAVAASKEQNATLVLGLYFYKRSFDFLFGSIRRYNNNNNDNDNDNDNDTDTDNNNNKNNNSNWSNNKWDFTVTPVKDS